ncbi:MAG: pre-tRNA nuclear export protein [Candelina mexicana]|nr:MAG: pre-tRNA nuclear export protein [Candelina mexicana]
MEAQVENAIEIAGDPSSDQALKTQAHDFLNQLRTDPSSCQVCLSLFTLSPPRSAVVRVVALDIVNNALQTGQLDNQGLAYVKDTLTEYIRRSYKSEQRGTSLTNGNVEDNEGDSVAVQNKLTQTTTYLFTNMYPAGWEDFFGDFLGLTTSDDGQWRGNLAGVVLYLRVLSSVSEEIADQQIQSNAEEKKRNNDLKDLIRVRHAKQIALSWQEILSQWQGRSDTVINLCLKAMRLWVGWTDITLILNQALLSLLFQLVGKVDDGELANQAGVDPVRNGAIDTVTEIVAKKMKAGDKLEMIYFLDVPSVVAQLIASKSLQDLKGTPRYDTDLAEAVARLVNAAAFDVVKSLDTDPVDDQTRQRADKLLEIFLPSILRFFSDEYDEVCSTVIPSLTELLTYFRRLAKTKGGLGPQYTSMLSPILNAIVMKMKYDETSSWGVEDEQTDEAEFQELRKRLQILQQTIAAIDPSLYIDTLSNVVGQTFGNLPMGQVDWRDLELALHEMYLFGELAVKNGGLYNKSQPSSLAAERLLGMMQQMMESDIASYSHPVIQLHYMELCVRYCAFFENQTQFIGQALDNFIRFVHHDHVKVKARSWYLFQRFCKHLRAQMGDIAQMVIRAISDLLIIKAELPEDDESDDDTSSEHHNQSAAALFDSQLYLFEAIGSISSTSTVPVSMQVLYAQAVTNPLISDLHNHLGPANNGDERASLQIHHIIMALGTLARGFSTWMPGSSSTMTSPPPEAVSEEFALAAEAILVALEALKASINIRAACRSSFSRLVCVLGPRILIQLPRWIDGLLAQSSTKDEMATFLKLLDQIVYGFKTEIFNILDSLLTPLLRRVFAGLAEPNSGTDDEIQLAELRREYLNFLLVILNNDLGSVLVSSVNQQLFETVIATIEHFAKDANDLPTAKLAFSVLIRMSSIWGGPDIAPASDPTIQTASPALQGFDHFMITRFSPLCWVLPNNPTVKPSDHPARQALGEVASLQKVIYAKTGQDYLTYLAQVEFKRFGFEGEPAEEYLRALAGMDGKAFKSFFLAFINQRRGN